MLLGAMRDANASLNNYICAPLKAALLHLCTMRDTDSSLFGLIGASLEAASFVFHLGAMRDANSSLNGPICTILLAASFCLSAVRDAHSSFNYIIGAPHRPAFCFTSFFIRCNRRPTVAFFHLRRLLLHLRLRLLLDDDAFVDNSSTSTGRHGRQKPRSKRSVEEHVG
jgi:hypothetical protein